MATPNPTPENHTGQPAAWAITYCPERDRFLIPKALNTMSAVYLIENTVTGFRYVGSSAIVGRRIDRHFQSPNNLRIKQDIEKYGRSSFKVDILEVVTDADARRKCEQSWIIRVHPEYNVHLFGGTGHAIPSAETRAKISAANSRRRHSEETKSKIGQAQIGRESWITGFGHSEVTRAKMSASHKGKIFSEAQREALKRGWAERRARQETIASWMIAVMIHCRAMIKVEI